jgi:hypothetical protein
MVSIMRSLTSIASGSLALALALGACGSSGNSSSATSGPLAGLTAKDIIKTTADKTPVTSLKFDMDGKLSVDTSKLSGIPADQLGALGSLASGLTVTGTGEQETAQRQSLTLNLKPLVDQPLTAVLYDGQSYFSLDGGKTFGSAGSLKSLTGGIGITPSDITGYLNALGTSVKDAGPVTKDGVATEHITATLDKDFLGKALGGAPGAGQGNLVQAFGSLITLRSGTLDAWVRQEDGRLDRTTMSFAVDFDLGKLGSIFSGSGGATPQSGVPTGVLTLALNLSIHLHDYGASIHITKPTVDANAPTLPPGIGGSSIFG